MNHMQEVTYFSDGDNYKVLTKDDLQLGRKEVAPLLTSNRMISKDKVTKNDWHADKIRELQMLRKELREL